MSRIYYTLKQPAVCFKYLFFRSIQHRALAFARLNEEDFANFPSRVIGAVRLSHRAFLPYSDPQTNSHSHMCSRIETYPICLRHGLLYGGNLDSVDAPLLCLLHGKKTRSYGLNPYVTTTSSTERAEPLMANYCPVWHNYSIRIGTFRNNDDFFAGVDCRCQFV